MHKPCKNRGTGSFRLGFPEGKWGKGKGEESSKTLLHWSYSARQGCWGECSFLKVKLNREVSDAGSQPHSALPAGEQVHPPEADTNRGLRALGRQTRKCEK